MKVAIVILNWNGKQLLQQFLPSILENSRHLAEIIVADNASTDDSIAYVKENYKEIKIIENSDNGGYAKGYNDALQHVQADIYALVNSDIEVSPGWLEPIIKQFESAPKTAAIQPKILDYKNKINFEYAGAGGGFIDKYGYPYCRGRVFSTIEKDEGQYNDTIDIFWASGACFFIRSEIFHSLNGFDESYFAHQEEIDLCWRIQRMGYLIKYAPKSVVYHLGGGTLSYQNPRKTFLNFRNSLIMVSKNKSGFELFINVFIRLILDGIAGVKFLLSGRPKDCWAIIKAHFSYYGKFSSIRQRKQFEERAIFTNKLSGPNTVHGIYPRSIVFDYFLKGIKHFSQLHGKN